MLWTAAENPKLEAAEAMGAAGEVDSPRLRDTRWARSSWGRLISLAEDIFFFSFLVNWPVQARSSQLMD